MSLLESDPFLDESEIRRSVQGSFDLLQNSLNETDTWKRVIPGKPLLNSFAAQTRLASGRFKLMYLREAENHNPNPFAEVITIFEKFAA